MKDKDFMASQLHDAYHDTLIGEKCNFFSIDAARVAAALKVFEVVDLIWFMIGHRQNNNSCRSFEVKLFLAS